MLRTELIRKIRDWLRDAKGVVWKDSELSAMLDRAAEAWSADTGAYKGRFNIVVSVDGSCELPANYVAFLAGWNVKTQRIEAMSSAELARRHGDYSVRSGLPEYVYEELDSSGRLRFSPNPYEKQSIRVLAPCYPYGIPVLPAYGIPVNTVDYGIPKEIYRFTNVGDVVYIRTESPEKISDPLALVYHVLGQAYDVDSDFADSRKALFFQSQYRARAARFGQVRSANAGARKRGNFF